MNWIDLENELQLRELINLSKTRPQVIFKHSSRCSISSVVKNRLERSAQPLTADFHFLDLIKNRSLSNKVAEDFAVRHESPQVLLIKNTECVYEESHNGIDTAEIAEQINLN